MIDGVRRRAPSSVVRGGRRDEWAMHSSELASALFGTWFDATAEAAFAVDPASGRVVCANTRFAQLLGVTPDEVCGTDLGRWLPAQQDALLAALRGVRYLEHLGFRNDNGEAVYLSLSLSQVELASQVLVACLGRDTSARHAREQERLVQHSELHAAHGDLSQLVAELSEAKLKLEDRNHEIAVLAGQVSRFGWRAAVGELVAGIAHHLNNPVGALSSTLRRLDRKAQEVHEPALRAELVALIARSREIGLRIENNVSAVVRTHAAGKSDISRQLLTLHHEIETALSMFADRLRRVVIVRDYQDHPPVCVPHDSLHLVLSNLLDNSLRAMGERGVLTIRTRTGQGNVALRISDSGGGVPAEMVPLLFDPILSARPGGAGLGLSTAQRLVRAWGGTVAHVPSTAGATFEIFIPTQGVDAPGPPAPHLVCEPQENYP